jgi:hypothetical protein
MKTIKLKKIASLSSLLLMLLVSSPSFSQGLPGAGAGEDDVNDEVTSPIDQNLMAGLIGGCLIAGFFFLGKKKAIETK